MNLQQDKIEFKNVQLERNWKMIQQQKIKKIDENKLSEMKQKSMLLQNKKLNLKENSINDRLDDFYNFRINHYNSKIEKFLMVM